MKSSSTILNKNGENRHSFVGPDLKRKVLSFSIVSMMLVVCFMWIPFNKLKKFPSVSSFLRVWSGIDRGLCQMPFLCLIKDKTVHELEQ